MQCPNIATRLATNAPSAPTLASVNYDVWGTNGTGLPIVLTGTGLAETYEVQVLDVTGSFTIASVPPLHVSSNSVIFTAPTSDPGSCQVRVVDGLGGESNTLPVTLWSPAQLTGLEQSLGQYVYSVSGGANAGWWNEWGGTRVWVASGADRPTYVNDAFAPAGPHGSSSIGGVRCNGANVLTPFSTAPDMTTSDRSLWAVVRTTSTDDVSAQPDYSVPLPLFGGSGGWGAFGMSGGQVALSCHSPSSVPSGQIVAGAGLNDGAAHLIGLVNPVADHTAQLWADGELLHTTAPATIKFAYLDRLLAAYGTDRFVGDIGALVIQKGVTSAPERALMLAWARQQFGVA